MPQPSNKDLLSIEKALDVAQEEYLKNGNDPLYRARAEAYEYPNNLKQIYYGDSKGLNKVEASDTSSKLGKFGFRDWLIIEDKKTATANLPPDGHDPALKDFALDKDSKTTIKTTQKPWPIGKELHWTADVQRQVKDVDGKMLFDLDMKCTTDLDQKFVGMSAPRLDHCKGTFKTKDGKSGEFESGHHGPDIYYRKLTEPGKKPVEILAGLTDEYTPGRKIALAWFYKGIFS